MTEIIAIEIHIDQDANNLWQLSVIAQMPDGPLNLGYNGEFEDEEDAEDAAVEADRFFRNVRNLQAAITAARADENPGLHLWEGGE
jgi:hypothetical protein